MSHEIHITDEGKASMAFTGKREAIWHGLGQAMEEGKSIEEWQKAAGMDFEIMKAPVRFQSNVGLKGPPTFNKFAEKAVLYRGDNKEPLAVVNPNFKIVQPPEVLEFFRNLCADYNFKLNTAGVLFGGKRYWALAETGRVDHIKKNDEIRTFLLLVTGSDGTCSTKAKYVTERVVCHNTLSIALSEKSQSVVKVTHKKAFDRTQVQADLGILDSMQARFIADMRKLASKKMDTDTTTAFLREMFYKRDASTGKIEAEQPKGVVAHVEKILNLALAGAGHEMHAGTAFGALCGITEFYTHGTGNRIGDRQFDDAMLGNYDKIKTAAYQKLLATV